MNNEVLECLERKIDDDDCEMWSKIICFALGKLVLFDTYHFSDLRTNSDLIPQLHDILSNLLVISRQVERKKALETMPYDEYLHTSEWREVRHSVLAFKGERCADCGSRDDLHIHHLTYEHRGNERWGDLVILCSDCHRRRHST